MRAESGYFGIGIYHGKHEVNQGTLWRTAAAFGAAFCFTVGRRFTRQASDTAGAWTVAPMLHFADPADLLDHLPYSCPLVGVELSGEAQPLGSFAHPDRACYLLGAEDHGLPPAVMSRCHYLVQIEGLASCLNVATAGALVMFDRKRKRGL